MRPTALLAFAATLATSALLHANDTPATDASALSPTLKSALTQLQSDDPAAREAAIPRLRDAIVQQVLALASQNDPEVQASLVPVLEFNDGLVRWAQDFLKYPDDVRATQRALMTRADLHPLFAKLFSARVEERLQATRDLAKVDAPGTEFLLARMIDDDERIVSLAAMEVAWNQKPSDVVVNALWRRAVLAGVGRALEDARANRGYLSFRGQPVAGIVPLGIPVSRSMDNESATEVLLHLNAPQLKKPLSSFFRHAADAVASADVTDQQLTAYGSAYPANIYPSIRNAFAIAQKYAPVEIVPSLYPLATCKLVQRSFYPIKGKRLFASNRTQALGLIVLLTGQKPEEYNLVQVERLWLATSDADEAAGVAKFQQWWPQNAARFTEPAKD